MVRLGLALGSNLGDRAAMLARALKEIVKLCDRLTMPVRLLEVSSLWKTKTWSPDGLPAVWSHDYLNAVMVVTLTSWPSTITADRFLAELLRIEARMGRRRQIRYNPRTIDIDWLYREDTDDPTSSMSSSVRLILPHVAMHERSFVLLPLSELYPWWRHPITGETTQEMLEALMPHALESSELWKPWPWMAFTTDAKEGAL
jgi:2-amino-4-hydroxy-6-hydroxymethyldihydropteridine diphosphokinase